MEERTSVTEGIDAVAVAAEQSLTLSAGDFDTFLSHHNSTLGTAIQNMRRDMSQTNGKIISETELQLCLVLSVEVVCRCQNGH